MDILTDSVRRAERKANLERAASNVRADLNRRLASRGLPSDSISLDHDRQDAMFTMYLSRVAALKAVASMGDALINPLKIAALSTLCILDARPLVSSQQQTSEVAYSNAYYAFQVALDVLQVRRKEIERTLQAHTVHFLAHVQHVAERVAGADGTRYEQFAYRFTMVLSFLTMLKAACEKPLPGRANSP